MYFEGVFQVGLKAGVSHAVFDYIFMRHYLRFHTFIDWKRALFGATNNQRSMAVLVRKSKQTVLPTQHEDVAKKSHALGY